MPEHLFELNQFLGSSTPDAWIKFALQKQDTLLIDHAHCEKKAAAAAIQLMFHYPTEVELLQKMSRIAREELIHFDQVCRIIQARNIRYGHLSASRYASGLRHLTRSHEPGRLIDRLVIGAFIEARSCERFACLVPHLDGELARFYRYLLKLEARHYQDYLALAKTIAVRQLGEQCNLSQRIELFRQQETELIQTRDSDFRFHSGLPTAS